MDSIGAKPGSSLAAENFMSELETRHLKNLLFQLPNVFYWGLLYHSDAKRSDSPNFAQTFQEILAGLRDT